MTPGARRDRPWPCVERVREAPAASGALMTLHEVEHLGQADVVLAYPCHTSSSTVAVELPTADNRAAVRYWLHQHPSRLADRRAATGPQQSRGERGSV
jgi:hypothetical protein